MRKPIVIILVIIITFFSCDFFLSKVLSYGVERFYGLNQHSEVLMIGHSHLMLAVDKEKIESELCTTVSKYTMEGVSVSDRVGMIDMYLNSKYSDSLKICLYGVDLCTFTAGGLSDNAYMLFYPYMDNPQISSLIKSSTSNTDFWLHKLVRLSRFNDDNLKNAAIRGWMGDWSNKKSGTIDVEVYKRKLAYGDERHIQLDPELISQFEESIKTLNDRGIKVILVNLPTLDLLNQFEPDKFEEITNWFITFSNNHDNVEYWDFNPEFSSRHELFHDRLHLNAKGQSIITEVMINRLKNEL